MKLVTIFNKILSFLFAFAFVSVIYAQEQGGYSIRPNVLFIMVDDLRPELGCYGKEKIISPNIDRLAERGQLFTQAHVNFPVCGPSRASLLSGLYASRTRFMGWNCSQDQDVPGIVSLPMHFKHNNYKTVSLGKVYNNFEDGKGSWDEIWRAPTTTTAWDYQSQEGIRIFEALNVDRSTDTRPRNNNHLPKRGVAFERAKVADVSYEDGRIANKAIEKLQELKTTAQPFFLAVGFKKPHLPFNAPEKYWAMYYKEDIRLPENSYQPHDSPTESMHNFSELRAYHDIPNDKPISDSLARQLIHGYYACVSYVDAQIGRVLDELENLGLEQNTIVVIWGDHGWQLGEHNLWCKHANFKTSLQIPLIFTVPGKMAGIQQAGLVESVDIYPTLCELAGLDMPFHLQGKSFAGMLDNPGKGGKNYLFSRSGLGGETVITNSHSYTEFFDKAGEVRSRMLYDLTNDPDENINIAENRGNEVLIRKLSQELNQHMLDRDRINLR